jgi:hypothetical protein
MDERQIEAIRQALIAAGIAEDVIAADMQALAAGLPLGRQSAAALERFQLIEGVDVQSILPTDPALPDAGPDAKWTPGYAESPGLNATPTAFGEQVSDDAFAASMDAAAALAAAGQAEADDQRLQQAIADAPFESAMGHAAQMAADDSGSGIQKLPYIAGQSGGGGEGGGDWSAMEITGLASGLAGSALGVAAPWLEQDTEYEDTLARRAAGDTIARREGTLAAGQMQRGIMATSIGRRDISPGLALRNAQMAGGQAASDIMARAAIASAAERQAAENQLAKMRAERIGQSINAGIGGLSQLGAFASSQAAAQKQDARAQRKLDAYNERTRFMGLGRG